MPPYADLLVPSAAAILAVCTSALFGVTSLSDSWVPAALAAAAAVLLLAAFAAAADRRSGKAALAVESELRNRLALDLMSVRNSYMHSDRSVSVGRAFKPKKTDVFVTTYPKCGTTWMSQIVHMLRSKGDMNFGEITEVVPWDILAHDCGQDLDASQGFSPRVYKSHEGWADIPKGGKYIYVARDPLDAFYSFYKFLPAYTGLGPDDLDQQAFADAIFAGASQAGQIWNHVRAITSDAPIHPAHTDSSHGPQEAPRLPNPPPPPSPLPSLLPSFLPSLLLSFPPLLPPTPLSKRRSTSAGGSSANRPTCCGSSSRTSPPTSPRRCAASPPSSTSTSRRSCCTRCSSSRRTSSCPRP